MIVELSGLTSHTLRHHSHSADGEGRPELGVRLHEEVVLACDANGASVVWKHDGRNVQHSAAYRVTGNSLRIARIGPQDQGAWQCDDAQGRSPKSAKAVWIVIIGQLMMMTVRVCVRMLKILRVSMIDFA